MTGVIGYARTMLHGGDFNPLRLDSLAEEVERFHETLAALSRDFGDPTLHAKDQRLEFPAGAPGRHDDACRATGDAAACTRRAGAVPELHLRERDRRQFE